MRAKLGGAPDGTFLANWGEAPVGTFLENWLEKKVGLSMGHSCNWLKEKAELLLGLPRKQAGKVGGDIPGWKIKVHKTDYYSMQINYMQLMGQYPVARAAPRKLDEIKVHNRYIINYSADFSIMGQTYLYGWGVCKFLQNK